MHGCAPMEPVTKRQGILSHPVRQGVNRLSPNRPFRRIFGDPGPWAGRCRRTADAFPLARASPLSRLASVSPLVVPDEQSAVSRPAVERSPPFHRVADFTSEWPRSNRNQWPTSFRNRRPTSPGIYRLVTSRKHLNGRFWTSRDVRDVVNSHVNYAVADTKQWGQSATYMIDTNPAVDAFVKNAGLGFAVPYFHNGRPHDYEPDFIIRLKGGEGRHLILETKGYDPLAEVKEQAARRLTAAVNAHGRHGKWDFRMVRRVGDIKEAIQAAGS